ncbi:uncharacterized protein LOC107423417 [Ziziphus jujuba]|uniref:Uncharacterized protein LOC107423417 n=2 Tax=Ziziphus jujuba TaxID=326968 RepID=A0A6P4A4Y0_ZIZJJ|nr:uncharacterized protein LOC107423417 [Ziziphus jujuba]KAH7519703.1 hypothetical protein FEM48_Zijuj08G0065400 [Ziziphus jujuba var. spinosa]
MDVEQEELQFLGLFGIFNESYKIIISWRKIFSQITLSLILPLAFIFLAHIEVSQSLRGKIMTNETDMMETDVGSRQYNRLNHILASEWSALFLIKALYFTFFLIFSLLSTSAVVYTIASIYTGREVSFRRTMSVVPKVWKRVMATFLCTFLAFFAYNVLAFFVMIIWVILGGFNYGLFVTGLFLLLVVYFAGILYMTFVWHLAGVVSVLEDVKGFQAMNKSQALMKGKMGIAICIFIILGLLSFAVQFAFQNLVVHAASVGMVAKAFYAILCFLLLVKLFLFGLVIQTVLYFVCKSYHHENIDKSALSDHLEVYLLGEYVPLKSKDIQLEQV